MSAFALEIEYLTGYAVATDHTSRDRPEWPPHPGRVFMALAAAHFETDGSSEEIQAERDALEWLAALDPPALSVPQASPRETMTVYVPVNDAQGLAALPSERPRQPRTFPRMHVGDQLLHLIWQGDGQTPRHLPALERIIGQVTRIGHSSSLVWVRVLREVESVKPTHTPVPDGMDARLRMTSAGELKRLEDAANFTALLDYRQLDAEARHAKGKTRKQLQARLHERFPRGEPATRRPSIALSTSYSPVRAAKPDVRGSCFDPNFIVLREADENEQVFGLESTLRLTTALRGAIMSSFGDKPIPPWVSGHDADGSKLDHGSHLALIPLPFVDHLHADGHVMGLGIVIPHDVLGRERAKALSSVLFHTESNEPRVIPLTMGRAGVFKVVRDTSVFPPQKALRPETWMAESRWWRSVTPIVLDRMPKTDRRKDPVGWREEVAGIVATACENIDLPRPIAVRVEKTPLLRGSLRAMPSQSGFSLIRPGTFQVHAEVTFADQVRGPVLLGAGRFRGYGLCRPVAEWNGG